MYRIELLTTDCQDILHLLNIRDRIKRTYMEVRQRFIEAVGSRMTFDPFECLSFLENLNANNSQGKVAILECEWIRKNGLILPVMKGLEPYIPFCSESELFMYLLGINNKLDPEREISELVGVLINQTLPGDMMPAIYHDKMLIYSKGTIHQHDWRDIPVYDQASVEEKRDRAREEEEWRTGRPAGSPGRPVRYQEEKRRRDHLRLIEKKKVLPSVGRKLKLEYLQAELVNEKNFYTMRLEERELYRILRTWAKPPKGESKYRYNQVGITQLVGLMERRRADMMMSGTKEQRKKAAKMRVSERSVRRYLKKLMKRGWIECVARGWPGIPGVLEGYVSRYRVFVSEKQRYKHMKEKEKRRKGR